MTTLSVPNSGVNSFTVLNATSISYNGTIYENVTDIAYPDGTHKTPSQLIQDAGGSSFSLDELKACVRVQAYDPDAGGRQVFIAYSSNSAQTGKNETSQVPGGVTVNMFDFSGSAADNYIVKMWADAGLANRFDPTWLGFKINYGISEAHSYVMTQVNDFNEESIPSPPTNVGVTQMHDAYLTGAFVAPAPLGSDLYVPIRAFKLYRAALTSNGGFVYQRVPIDPISIKVGLNNPVLIVDPLTLALAKFPHSVYLAYPGNYIDLFGFAWRDNVLTENLLESLPSLDWDAPPPRKLKGLVAWRNGTMAAYDGNQLYLCEPYRPFAWPAIYIKALPFEILGLRVDENALIAVTRAEPYQFLGSHPLNVTYERLQGVQAALPPLPTASGYLNPTRAIVRTPKGVVYATREGAVNVAGGRATPIWGELFTREEWVGRYGAYFGSMRMAYFDNNIVVYFDNLSLVNGFIVNIDGAAPRLVEYSTVGQVADFVLPLTDSMYIVNYQPPVSTMSRFSDESTFRMSFVYQTRDVIEPRPVNFGGIQIVGLGSIIATVFADGAFVAALSFTFPPTIPGRATMRLPSGFKAIAWSVRLAGAPGALVSEVHLAETLSELKNV